VQPDVAICGGIDEALFVAELAAIRGRQCVPHAWGGAVLLAATLQLLAVMRDPSEVPGHDSPLLEVDRLENPLRTGIWGSEITPVDGTVEVPTGPGLGITVDEEFVRRIATISRRHVSTDR
jgi:D-galactarolactone cycloisomerase